MVVMIMYVYMCINIGGRACVQCHELYIALVYRKIHMFMYSLEWVSESSKASRLHVGKSESKLLVS